MSTTATPDDAKTVNPTVEETTTGTLANDTGNVEADKARAEELKNQANEYFKSEYGIKGGAGDGVLLTQVWVY